MLWLLILNGSLDCGKWQNLHIDKRKSLFYEFMFSIRDARHCSHALVFANLISSSQKAYNSVLSNCSSLNVVLISFRSSRAQPAPPVSVGERWGGGGHHLISLSHEKKHRNVAGIWSQWWCAALVPGRGFRWRLEQSWWQKENMYGGAVRLRHYWICGEVACVGKRPAAVKSVSTFYSKNKAI